MLENIYIYCQHEIKIICAILEALMCLMVGSNALVINFTVMLKITSLHHSLQNPISQRTYALETKIFSSKGDETRTHEGSEGFINTYVTRTAEVETTELPVHEEE